jgi:hypothetical protein
MENRSDASLEPTPIQLRYALVLEKGMYLGLLCLFVTYALYVFGIVEANIPREQIPELWTKSVHEYLHDTDIDAGWSWVTMLRYSDFLNFIGIAILAGVSIVCYLAILPMLLEKKDYVYAVLALLEVIVLAVAASGIIAVGH